jgi:hypothetical protein
MDTGTGESKLLTVACPNLTNCHTQNDELGFSREVAHLLALLLPQKKTRPLLAMAALLLGPAWIENTPSFSRPETRVGVHVMICSVEPMPS